MVSLKAKVTACSGNILVLQIDGNCQLELEKEYRVEIKEWRESRSQKQNRLLWGLLRAIDKAMNGISTEEGLMEVYAHLIKQAQIKTEFLQGTPEVRASLEKTFRLVVERQRRISEKGVETVIYEVYSGSSTFDTKEMSDFLEQAFNMAGELGVATLQFTELRYLNG